MRISSGNYATLPEPSMWPLMPTPMAAANRRRCVSHNVSGNEASLRQVSLPDGHDPNSFFTAGGDARQFQALLESAAQ